jgi:hypothetical protein
MKSASAVRPMLVALAGAIVLPYTLLNVAGLIGVDRIQGILDVILLVAPILAFPLYLVCFWSARKSSILLALNFCILHLGYFSVDWPHWATLLEALRIDWPLPCCSILLYVAALRNRSR